jgi:paraquat-inducible protein B
MSDHPGGMDSLPTPEIRRRSRWSLSLIWLVPVIAAAAGLILAVRTYLEAGPTITISFETGEGLEAGKTEMRYKNVVVGTVKRIVLSEDHSKVLVKVALEQEGADVAMADSRFWVERPRFGLSGVSGIGTLISGAYIGVDIGSSKEKKRNFTGLEKPPGVTHDMKGRRFVLHTADSSSLAAGSPLYFRRIAVGEVVASELDADGKDVTVQVFVDAPYDRFVTKNTHFWNASGIDVALNASGLKVNTQSLATVIAGGVAFQPLDDTDPGASADENTEFHLYPDKGSALAPPDGESRRITMRFTQPVRGLSVGAPVDFEGITIGSVTSILLNYDPTTQNFYTDVQAEIFPDRMGPAVKEMLAQDKKGGKGFGEMWRVSVERGLRAELSSASLITGQMYVGLDFIPHSKPVQFDPDGDPLVMPTASGGMQQLQQQLQDIVSKLDQVPFDELGRNLNSTLKSASSLLHELDTEVAPEAKKTLKSAEQALDALSAGVTSPDSPLQQNLGHTLKGLDNAAASLRALANYLEQHPESLLRGKSNQEPGANSGTDAGANATVAPTPVPAAAPENKP